MALRDCRMYEARYPEVDDVVMVQVKSIAEMGAYVSLLEYNNIEGMILLSELSRRRIRSVTKLIKVGRVEPVMVLRVDKEKGYIDLSKRRVAPEDVAVCEERFNKSKLVHSIMRHVAETTGSDVNELYETVGWPLYKRHGHAFEAFKLLGQEPDAVLSELTVPAAPGSSEMVPAVNDAVREALLLNIRRRMTPQPLKIRADVEMTCFNYDGVLHIKAAMRAAQALSVDDRVVKMKLVAPPLYVLTTQTLEKEAGIKLLEAATAAAAASIEAAKGRLVVKEGARAVSERDEKLLAEKLDKLAAANEEVSGDDEDEEDETMGSGEIEAPPMPTEAAAAAAAEAPKADAK